MNARVYYNEFDPFAADWLEGLIKAGLIPEGDVDRRSITKVQPTDLSGYAQCHFFAGIGGWSYALRLADWPSDLPVWTGSCPCQPFSVAGKGKGAADERHLWPEFHRLISECRPPVVFGEQVASKAGRIWLAGVRADLEGVGYGVGAADLCAAGIGAPHIRQRLFWVADTEHDGSHREGWPAAEPDGDREDGRLHHRGAGGVGLAIKPGLERLAGYGNGGNEPGWEYEKSCGSTPSPGPSGLGEWADSDYITCGDGKARRAPLEPALFPLADGLPGRVGLLRGAGNAIVPPLAAEFIQAYCEAV